MEAQKARHSLLSLPPRVGFAQQLSLVDVHTDLTRKRRVLNSLRPSATQCQRWQRQRRPPCVDNEEDGSPGQVRAHEAPHTGAAHTTGASDSHLALLAHHDVCIHAGGITLRCSPEAVQCSKRGAEVPRLRSGPPPPFSFVAIRLNSWSCSRDPRVGPRVCRDPRNNQAAFTRAPKPSAGRP
jgi:hypothetical protein